MGLKNMLERYKDVDGQQGRLEVESNDSLTKLIDFLNDPKSDPDTSKANGFFYFAKMSFAPPTPEEYRRSKFSHLIPIYEGNPGEEDFNLYVDLYHFFDKCLGISEVTPVDIGEFCLRLDRSKKKHYWKSGFLVSALIQHSFDQGHNCFSLPFDSMTFLTKDSAAYGLGNHLSGTKDRFLECYTYNGGFYHPMLFDCVQHAKVVIDGNKPATANIGCGLTRNSLFIHRANVLNASFTFSSGCKAVFLGDFDNQYQFGDTNNFLGPMEDNDIFTIESNFSKLREQGFNIRKLYVGKDLLERSNNRYFLIDTNGDIQPYGKRMEEYCKHNGLKWNNIDQIMNMTKWE